jgi:hypothetical protein
MERVVAACTTLATTRLKIKPIWLLSFELLTAYAVHIGRSPRLLVPRVWLTSRVSPVLITWQCYYMQFAQIKTQKWSNSYIYNAWYNKTWVYTFYNLWHYGSCQVPVRNLELLCCTIIRVTSQASTEKYVGYKLRCIRFRLRYVSFPRPNTPEFLNRVGVLRCYNLLSNPS